MQPGLSDILWVCVCGGGGGGLEYFWGQMGPGLRKVENHAYRACPTIENANDTYSAVEKYYLLISSIIAYFSHRMVSELKHKFNSRHREHK